MKVYKVIKFKDLPVKSLIEPSPDSLLTSSTISLSSLISLTSLTFSMPFPLSLLLPLGSNFYNRQIKINNLSTEIGLLFPIAPIEISLDRF